MSVDLLEEENFEDLKVAQKSLKIQEMLRTLQANKSSMQEMDIANQEVLIFSLLTKTITDARNTGFRSIGTELTRLTIREYLPWIYRNLNSGKHSVIQTNLQLLVALVMHGQSTTKELLDTFNFTLKPLNGFLKIRKKSSTGDDIRSLYIKFLLGFIIRGDSLVKRAILEMKNLLGLIFKDIAKDSYKLIEFILDTLKKGIIEDQRIPRSAKLSYFNHNILVQILGLFEESKDLSKPKDDNQEGSIPDLTLDFLRALCVIPGQGICFCDAGWTDSKLNNTILSKLLKNLKVVDIRQRKLFIEILSSCPELVSNFWNNCSHLSFEPRSSVFYLSNISLASEVINLKIPQYFGAKIDKSTTFVPPPPIETCIANILPHILGKSSASRALQSSARDVRFACGKLLSFSFLKLKQVLEMAKNIQEAIKFRLNETDLKQLETAWSEWETNLILEFRLLLPDPQIIIALQKSSKQEPTEEDVEITVDDLVVSYLELLKLYQVYNPYQMRETRYDYGKLLLDIYDSTNAVKLEILEIIGNVDGFKYWTVPKGSSQSYLHILLQIFLLADDVLRPKVKTVLQSIIENSFGFKGHQSILLWDTLLQFKQQGNAIVQFIDSSFSQNAKSPFLLVDDMLAFGKFAGFDNSVYPFAPVYLQFLRSLLSENCGVVKVFISAVIVQDCAEKGLEMCRIYQKAMEFVRGKLEFDCISQSLYSWLCLSAEPANKTANGLVDWQNAKIILKNSLDFATDLFKFSPFTFSGNWNELFSIFENYNSIVLTYIILNARFVNPIMEVTRGVPESLALHIVLTREAPDVDYTSFQNSLLARFESLDLEEKKSLVSHTLFLLELCNAKSDYQNARIELALSIFEQAMKYSTLRELILESTTLIELFMPIDLHYDIHMYQRIIKLISAGNKVNLHKFKTKFLSAIGLESKTAMQFSSLSFQALRTYFEFDEIQSILNSILTKESPSDYEQALLWQSMQSLSSEEVDENLLVKAIIQSLAWNDGVLDESVGQIVSILGPESRLASLIDHHVVHKIVEKQNPSNWSFLCFLSASSACHAVSIMKYAKASKYLSIEQQIQFCASVLTHIFSESFQIRAKSPEVLVKFCKKFCKRHVKDISSLVLNAVTGKDKSVMTPELRRVFAFGYMILGESSSLDFCSALKDCVRKPVESVNDAANALSVLQPFIVLLKNCSLQKSIVEYQLWVICAYFNMRKRLLAESVEEQTLERLIYELGSSFISSVSSGALDESKISSKLVKELILASLKYRFQNFEAILLLETLVKNCELKDSAADILKMITTHSAFEHILFDKENLHLKNAALKLILALTSKDLKNCCEYSLLKKIATAYRGTLSPADQTTVKIFRLYEEEANLSISNVLSCWDGQSEGNAYISTETLGAIDSTLMANTIHWFPIDRDVDFVSETTSPQVYSSKILPLYDPAFFLPLLGAIIQNSHEQLDVHRLLETNIIGLAIAAFSSTCLSTRKVAHFVVSGFYDSLTQSSVKEKNQVLLLLDAFRNSIVSTKDDVFPEVSSVITSFVAQGLMILIKPESDMYPLINRFCLQRAAIDFEDIPMFYELFYSSSEELKKERVWMLRLLLNGLRSKRDYLLFRRRHVCDILFAFFQSPLADQHCRKLIFEILLKASIIPSVISNLITKSGFLLFLKQCCSKFACCEGNEMLLALPRLVNSTLKGFNSSPEAWDGIVARTEWISEFQQITAILIESIPSLCVNKSVWVANYIFRVTELAKSLSLVSQASISENHLCILESIVGCSSFSSKNSTLNDFDLDCLFTVENQGSDVKEAFYSIFHHVDQKIVFKSEKLTAILIRLMNDEFPVADDLLKWLMSSFLNGSYQFLAANPLISVALIKFLTKRLKSRSSNDNTHQLARACLLLYYRDLKKTNLKRDFAQMDSETPDIVKETVEKWISETPTPVYLLAGGEAIPDSFYASLLGDLLIDAVMGSGLELWKSSIYFQDK